MEVRYSAHLRFKLQVRKIPADLPERIYRESNQRFFNHHSVRHIAVMETRYQHRRTLMMIAYDQFPDYVEIITIHPITKTQIEERLQNGVMPKSQLHYDASQDILYIVLREGEEHHFDEIAEGIVIEFDENGHPIGIEINNASKIVTQAIGRERLALAGA